MGQILPFTRGSMVLDPEALALAIRAYDRAMVGIGSRPEAVREVVAKHIIHLITQGERDTNVLSDRALVYSGIPAEADPAGERCIDLR